MAFAPGVLYYIHTHISLCLPRILDEVSHETDSRFHPGTAAIEAYDLQVLFLQDQVRARRGERFELTMQETAKLLDSSYRPGKSQK